MEEEGALEIQQVECFERDNGTAAWRAVGEGTVLWQAGAEGRMEQRLLVMQPDDRGEWARELECLDFPDPCASISCQPEDSVIMWRHMGQSREVALAFRSTDGCQQVWEDMQALQSLVMQAVDGAPTSGMGAYNPMSDYLDQFADLYGADGMDGMEDFIHGMRGGQPLPTPTEEALPAIAMHLAACPPGLAPLLLQQLVGDAAAPPSSPSSPSPAKPAASAANLAESARTLASPPAPDAPPRDYVGQLAALSAQLSAGVPTGAADALSPASSSPGASSGDDATSSAHTGGAAAAPASEGAASPDVGARRAALLASASDAAIARTASRMQLGAVFRALLTIAADDASLLQRLLMPDALTGLLLCLEADESRLHYQTRHVNTQHVAFLADAGRFRMPCPIADPNVLQKVHQNFAISYLTDAALPLSLEPGTSAALSELQGANGKEIVVALCADTTFVDALFDGLGVGPPRGFAEGQLGGSSPPPAPRAPSGRAGGAVPAPPADEPTYLQLWGLLRELSSLAAALHPVGRVRVYRTLCARGLVRALALALAPAVGSGPREGIGRRQALDAQVRALDVLLFVLNHDCAIVRLACVDLPQSASWGGRADARALVSALVRLLGESSDEGLLTQASESVRILLDPTSMEPSEQNAFLDYVYGAGQLASLLSLLRARAREALAPAHRQPASAPADGTRASAADVAAVGMSESIAAGSEGAGYAGPRVARIESLLEVIGGSLGVHGYRSQRLTQDANLWHALRDLLAQPRTSVRASATRLLRTLLQLHPLQTAPKLEELSLAGLLFTQLRTRPAPDGSPRDSLANSAVLSTLQLVVDLPELESVRTHLLTDHRAEVESLAAHRVIPCVALVHAPRADLAAASAAATPRQLADGGHPTPASGTPAGAAPPSANGSPSPMKSHTELFGRPRSPSSPAARDAPADASPLSATGSSREPSPSNPGLSPALGAGHGAFAPSANSAFTAMRSRGTFSDASSDSPQRSPPSLPTPPSAGGHSSGSPPSGGSGLCAGVGQLLSHAPPHPPPPPYHAHNSPNNSPSQTLHNSPSGNENFEAVNRPNSPRPGSAGQSPTKAPPALPAQPSSALGGGRPLTPR